MLGIISKNLHANATILLVEDDRLNRFFLREIFVRQGFTHILEAEDGEDALQKTLEHSPDLVVLDITMPKMNGLEYCAALRKNSAFTHTPVLVQTGLDTPQAKAAIFNSGATDYICKPIDPAEIIARAIVHLEHQQTLKQLKAYQLRIIKEFTAAQTMQKFLLPPEEILQQTATTHRLALHHHFQPCDELGGDFWGCAPLSPTLYSVYCVDFAGHGLDAALNTFRLHTLLQEYPCPDVEAGAYLEYINKKLTPLLSIEQFATMFYAVVNIEKSTLHYASASSPQPFLFKQHHGAQQINCSGLPLGITQSATYTTHTLPFETGDTLFLYSDCLTETPDSTGNVWAEDDILHYITNTLKPYATTQAFAMLLGYFQKHYGTMRRDDLTLVMMERLP